MKFIVREGFVVQIRKVVKGPKGEPNVQENSYYPGEEVVLDKDQVDDHAHKLEPADKAATAYLESKVRSTSGDTVGIPMDQVQAMIDKAVAAAIAKAPGNT